MAEVLPERSEKSLIIVDEPENYLMIVVPYVGR
jgi:hypothetical protein